MSLVFDPEKHLYILDGNELPSVTEICRFLNYDVAAGAKPWLWDAAADRGTRVHEWCMLHDYGDLYEADVEADALGYVKAYIAFCRDYGPEWELIEHPMACAAVGYGGTLDRLGKIDGKLSLLDIKTTSVLRKVPLAAQLAGYETLLMNDPERKWRVESFYGLHLKNDGCYDLVPIAPDYESFDVCLMLHNKLKRKKRGFRE